MLLAASRRPLDVGWDMTTVMRGSGSSTLPVGVPRILGSLPTRSYRGGTMNAVGKTISTVIYLIALLITYLVAKDSVPVVAVVGVVLFFAVHLTLRSRQGSKR